ncbi:MAG TPA: MBL fold metallo-hydrolase [Rhodocyclaceae bacterium]|nr:MBL fold metallo-hydrolase [Rhodocyclaceae bacterium]
MRISFLGAAREVTGSCFLVEGGGARFLVDCGMFQGGREAYRRNLSALALGFPAKALDFVILTHAHIDHSGLLPRLTAFGFRGPVYATPATCDLAEVLLLDSAHIQEKEAEWENRHEQARHARRGWERAPLYTVNQARECLRQLRPCPYDTEWQPHSGIRFVLRDAGHILGSAIVELWLTEDAKTRKIVFSGDLGQPARPVLRDPTFITEADVLIVESTYGNRRHKTLTETEDELVWAFEDTLRHKGGNIIMPAFAVGRTQEVLFILTDLVRHGRLPPMAIHVDSPMAESATGLTLRHQDLLDAETRELIVWQQRHPDRPSIRFVQEVEESMALNEIRSGAVIIAASGMCDAGRVKHHLRYNLSRRECSVVITGFQAAGTLGRRLVDGARWVRIFGEELPVRADIYTIGGLSAHADRDALLGWLRHFKRPPARCFIVHGEAQTALLFAAAVRELGWPDVVVPEFGEVQVLDEENGP